MDRPSSFVINRRDRQCSCRIIVELEAAAEVLKIAAGVTSGLFIIFMSSLGRYLSTIKSLVYNGCRTIKSWYKTQV